MWYTEQATIAPQKAMPSVRWELQSGCGSGSGSDYFNACGLLDFLAWQINCSGAQVPRFFAQDSHTFVHLWFQVLHDWKKIWDVTNVQVSATFSETPYTATCPSRCCWAQCWAKCKLASEDWPWPYGAGGRPRDMLWQTPACPGEVINRCTWVWLASCYCFHAFLHVIDLVFIFPHPEKADYKPFPVYLIYIVKTELVS